MGPRRAAAEAGITIEPSPHRVVVRVDDHVIADSTRALVMRAPGSPDTLYIPRADVEMARLIRTSHATHCPFKGDASYFSIVDGPQNAAWSYERPYDEMLEIRDLLAFYPSKVDSIALSDD
jgi:uncharacterized protein (DUF427 family)